MELANRQSAIMCVTVSIQTRVYFQIRYFSIVACCFPCCRHADRPSKPLQDTVGHPTIHFGKIPVVSRVTCKHAVHGCGSTIDKGTSVKKPMHGIGNGRMIVCCFCQSSDKEKQYAIPAMILRRKPLRFKPAADKLNVFHDPLDIRRRFLFAQARMMNLEQAVDHPDPLAIVAAFLVD